MHIAFYDPHLSFEENYEKGPLSDRESISLPKRKITSTSKFLGFDINVPFGIPAGPIPNSKFVQAAFSFGFDIITYKTVRAQAFPSHPFPNILYVDAPEELHPEQTPRLLGKLQSDAPIEMLSITNSFGVPSVDPSLWQEDVRKALQYVGNGQMLILSFMGTVHPNQTEEEFIDDFAKAAKMAKETGVNVLEVNLSCPNLGNEGLVCYNLEMTEKVLKAIRNEIGDTPLIVKIGYYKDGEQLKKLAHIVDRYAQCISAINTLQIEIVNEDGKQALIGANRLKSGVCGSCIKWAGIEMVKKLHTIRKEHTLSFEILGVGGVMTADDYLEYKKAGADAVQSGTGAMWNAYLAHDIWKKQEK